MTKLVCCWNVLFSIGHCRIMH